MILKPFHIDSYYRTLAEIFAPLVNYTYGCWPIMMTSNDSDADSLKYMASYVRNHSIEGWQMFVYANANTGTGSWTSGTGHLVPGDLLYPVDGVILIYSE